MAAAQASGRKAPPRRSAGGDIDETEALEIAAATLKGLAPHTPNPQAVAHAVISTWIIERMKRHTSGRITETCVFNLGDAHLVGMVEAALPKIGDALASGGFPFSASFGDLTKQQAVMLFMAGVVAHREAAIAAGEAPGFPFDEPFSDPIPFGDPTPATVAAKVEAAFVAGEEGAPWA